MLCRAYIGRVSLRRVSSCWLCWRHFKVTAKNLLLTWCKFSKNLRFLKWLLDLGRESSLKGKDKYSWPPCTNKFKYSWEVLFSFTLQAALTRRSSVLSLPMQYGFLAERIWLTGMVDIKIKQDDKMKLTSCTLATSSWAKSSKTFYGLICKSSE